MNDKVKMPKRSPFGDFSSFSRGDGKKAVKHTKPEPPVVKEEASNTIKNRIVNTASDLNENTQVEIKTLEASSPSVERFVFNIIIDEKLSLNDIKVLSAICSLCFENKTTSQKSCYLRAQVNNWGRFSKSIKLLVAKQIIIMNEDTIRVNSDILFL